MISQNILVDPITKIEGVDVLYNFSSVTGLLITSANAVAYLPAALVGSKLPTFCVGEATTRVALKQGLMAQHLAATAEDLYNVLSGGFLEGPLLHLRGTHTTLDFEAYFRDTLIEVQNLIIYQQSAQDLKPATYTLLRGMVPIVLPIFSLRSAELLCELELNWALHTCVAISEVVAIPCRAAGFGQVLVSPEPSAGSMLSTLTSLFAEKSG